MQCPTASVVRFRTSAVAATLLVHAGLVWLFIEEKQMDRRTAPPDQVMVNVWIHLPAPAPVDREPAMTPDPGDTAIRGVAPADLPVVVPPRADAPTSEPPLQPLPPAELIPSPPSQESRSDVDWYRQAETRAERLAAVEVEARDIAGRVVQRLREPCQPRDSSFEWNPQEERRGLLPLPFILIGERCGIGLGFFGCNLGALPEPNKHLFDDMQAGRTPRSSVPHHEHCN